MYGMIRSETDSMRPVVSIVMATVNASYATPVTPDELARRIVDPESARTHDCAAFAFFSDVAPHLQRGFIEQMEVDPEKARLVAGAYSVKAGYKLALAA